MYISTFIKALYYIIATISIYKRHPLFELFTTTTVCVVVSFLVFGISRIWCIIPTAYTGVVHKISVYSYFFSYPQTEREVHMSTYARFIFQVQLSINNLIILFNNNLIIILLILLIFNNNNKNNRYII